MGKGLKIGLCVFGTLAVIGGGAGFFIWKKKKAETNGGELILGGVGKINLPKAKLTVDFTSSNGKKYEKGFTFFVKKADDGKFYGFEGTQCPMGEVQETDFEYVK